MEKALPHLTGPHSFGLCKGLQPARRMPPTTAPTSGLRGKGVSWVQGTSEKLLTAVIPVIRLGSLHANTFSVLLNGQAASRKYFPGLQVPGGLSSGP